MLKIKHCFNNVHNVLSATGSWSRPWQGHWIVKQAVAGPLDRGAGRGNATGSWSRPWQCHCIVEQAVGVPLALDRGADSGSATGSEVLSCLYWHSFYQPDHSTLWWIVVGVSGVPQDSILGPLLFLLYTLELFSILENKLIGYADDSTLMAVVPFPGFRVA